MNSPKLVQLKEAVHNVSDVANQVKESKLNNSGGAKDIIGHVKEGAVERRQHTHNALETMLKYMPIFIGNGLRGILKQTMYEKFKEAMEYLSTHPVLALPLFAVITFIGIPVFTFAIFAIISTIVTFIGFLLIEGTMVGVGALVMIACVLAVFGFVFLIFFGISITVFILQKLHIL